MQQNYRSVEPQCIGIHSMLEWKVICTCLAESDYRICV